MKPDRGTVTTRGRVSSLLELGAGFHPELSGVENIILNGILSGNTREEMLMKMEEIIAFSELGEFVYQPLRTYSSGMYARLGFSVAVHINPEILLVDEALAVGDAEFKEKCTRKMKEFMESGATIIIVSHDMPAIRELCNRVAWIDSGVVMEIGDPETVIGSYLTFLGMPPDGEEEKRLPESATPVTDEHGFSLFAASVEGSSKDFSQSVMPGRECADHDIQELEPVELSWWDSPVVMHHCESIITGDPRVSFYEYVRRKYNISGLGKGLSMCRRLQGIEQNFSKYNTCASFDTIDGSVDPQHAASEINALKPDRYDLVLFVDTLSHVFDLEHLLRDVMRILRGDGFIIAIEYTGPAHFQWADKEVESAALLLGALDGLSGHTSSQGEGFGVVLSGARKDTGAATAANSCAVIPTMEKMFDIIDVTYFGGAFHELVLDKILPRLDQSDAKDIMLMRAVMECEQILVRNHIIKNHYALIIGKKR